MHRPATYRCKSCNFFTGTMLRISEGKRKLVFILLSESNIADGQISFGDLADEFTSNAMRKNAAFCSHFPSAKVQKISDICKFLDNYFRIFFNYFLGVFKTKNSRCQSIRNYYFCGLFLPDKSCCRKTIKLRHKLFLCQGFLQ